MKLLSISVLLALSLVTAGCGQDVPVPSLPPSIQTPVSGLTNVHDDDYSSVYIQPDSIIEDSAAAVGVLMAKKKLWEIAYPAKKVVAIAIVTGDSGGYGHPCVAGLLIHYEKH